MSKANKILFRPADLPLIVEYAPDGADAHRRVYLLRSTRAGKLLLTRPEFVPRDGLVRASN